LQAVANNLADDQVLGRKVVARGYKLTLAQLVPATTVPEADFKALYRHELRWARTIRALVPVPYAASVLQISLLWAALAILFSWGAVWAWALFVAVLAARVLSARRIDAALRLQSSGGPWLFLLRDLFSTIIYIASFTGSQVDWRGRMMHADSGQAPLVVRDTR
jgi:ceramide glucosyltransferase